MDKFAPAAPGDRKGFSFLHLGSPAQQNDDSNSLAHKAISCLAQRYYGQFFNLSDIKQNSQVLYGETLQLIHYEISRTPKQPMERIFLVVSILASVCTEILSAYSSSGSYSHVIGLSGIIQAFGPHVFQDTPALMLFETSRAFAAAYALKRGQRTVFAQEEWKTIPWMTTEKPTIALIWDVM